MDPSQIRAGLGLLNHYLPSVQDIHSYDEIPAQINPEEAWDNIAQFLRESGTDGIEEMKKRGVIIQVGKPELKVIR